MIKYKIGLVVLGVLLVTSLFFGNQYRKESDLYKTKVQNDFNTKYLLLEQRFRTSERERMVLVHHSDSLDNRSKSLDSALHVKDAEIKKIKGSYNKRTPSELETEMIKRANGSR